MRLLRLEAYAAGFGFGVGFIFFFGTGLPVEDLLAFRDRKSYEDGELDLLPPRDEGRPTFDSCFFNGDLDVERSVALSLSVSSAASSSASAFNGMLDTTSGCLTARRRWRVVDGAPPRVV